MTERQYDTVIVGGGMAGLTSAAYLARSGKRVLLIEKNEKCGGLVSTFSRNGFTFEAGVRALEDAGIILPMLADLGIEIELVKSPVSVGIEDKVIHAEDLSSLQDYRNLLVGFYPDSEKDIDRLIRIIRRIMKDMEVLYGIENPAFKDIPNDRKFLFRKLLPWLPRFLFTVSRINRMNMPVEPYVEGIIQDASLRDIIVQHFFKNTPTFFALSYFSLYLDYFYPLGGVGKLAEAVVEKVVQFGGGILTGSAVTEVDLSAKTVTDGSGSVYSYGDLIWAADMKTFYRVSRSGGLAPRVRQKFSEAKQRVDRSRGGDSVFTVFVEVDEDLESFRKIAHGHFFYTPGRQGLGETHWSEMRELIRNFSSRDKAEILLWLDKFTSLNTYEISIPGLKDPEMVPAGKTGLIISFLAEYDLFKAAMEAGWYEEFKTEMEDRILKVLSDTIYPMLKGRILGRYSFTPVSIEQWNGSSEGAITGWSFEKPVPVVNRIQYSARSVLSPLSDVYFAGQWAYSPGGVPMAVLTGKLAADKIVKKKTRRKI